MCALIVFIRNMTFDCDTAKPIIYVLTKWYGFALEKYSHSHN